MKKLSEICDRQGTKYKIVITAMFAVGLLMLCIPSLMNDGNGEVTGNVPLSASDEISAYSDFLEDSLRKTVASAVGSEAVDVMVTLESTFENVYVSDASVNEAVTASGTDRKSEKQLVLTGTSGNVQTPVVVKRLPPRVKGAVIVCPNGDEPTVKARVTALAATALSVSEAKIYVTGGM